MKANFRRLFSMLLVLAMIVSMIPAVMAEEEAVTVDASAAFCEAMAAGGTIKLTGSFELTALATVPADKTVVLDLNGQTISSTNEAYHIANAGTLTIMDSREGGEIKMTPASESAAVSALKNTGKLTINGGKITTTTKSKTAQAISSEASSVTINGGTFEANYNATGGSSAYTIVLLGDTSGSSVATINGGTFIAKSKSTGNSRCAAIFANCDNTKKITITINGGTFEGIRDGYRGASAIRFRDTQCGATVVINDGTFRAGKTADGATDDRMFAGSLGALTINGGTFTYDTLIFTDARKATINGGTFVKFDGTANDISSYVKVEGCTQNEQGIVALGVDSSEAFVAAMAKGGSIRLTADIALAAVATIPAGKTVVLDLNGKTLSSDNEANRIENAGNLTIMDSRDGDKDGQITMAPTSESTTVYGLKNTSKLTINGGKITATTKSKAVYAVYSESSSVTINGGTIEANYNSTGSGSAYGVGLMGDTSGSSVATINGGTFIATSKSTANSRCAAIFANGAKANKITITINGGTFEGSRDGYRGASVIRFRDTECGATVVINDGTFTAGKTAAGSTDDRMFAGSLGALTIKGGTFTYDTLIFTDARKATITGGTFVKFDGTKNDISGKLAEGYLQTENGAVVKGEKSEVATFDAFIAALATGGEITLTDSFELTEKATVPAGVTVVLDLNGQTITSNDGAKVYISNEGDLTILDSSTEQTGTIVSNGKSGSASTVYGLNNSGNLTIEGGSFKAETSSSSCYVIYSTGPSLEINGGTFEGNCKHKSSWYVSYLLCLGGTDSIITINGGKFTVNNMTPNADSRCSMICALKSSNAQITINDGDFTATREGSDGASFVRWSDSTSKQTVTIKGGKIAVTEGDTIGMFETNSGTLRVIGGQFLNIEGEPYDVMKYLYEGYEQLDDGTVVVDDPNMPVVVELDGVKYKSLLRALKKSNAGDVLALSADVQLEEVLELPEAVHIDLQGNTLEVPGLIADGSQIIDSAQQGLLKVAKDKAIFAAGNAYLPVWDGAAGGYRLAQVKIQTKAAATAGVYYFRYDLVNADWEKLLLENMEDSATKVSLLLHVDGIATPFEAPANMLKALYEDATGKGAIKVTFNGMEEKLDIQVGVGCHEVEITKSTGSEPAPVMVANGPTGEVDTLPAETRTYLADAAAKYDNAGVAGLTDASLTSAKSPINLNLYKNLQPVAFNWTLENAEFIKADTKFYIELSTSADFADSRMVECVNYVAGRKTQSEPVWNLMTDATYYWRVVTTLADGTVLTTETMTIQTEAGPRLIYVDGAENTRDQGGWLVSCDVVLSDGTVVYKAGERTTQGRVYRSGRLETLTADGIKTIVNELGIKTELDLRERNADYDVVSAYGVNFVQRSDGKTCLDYEEFLNNPERAKEALLVFANADNYPILYNCYYGADRTGSLAFVLGALQGVSVEDLVKDYELTTSRYLHRGESLDIKAFIAEFDKLEGANLYEKARTFCKSAGLTDTQIDTIIRLLSGV